MKKCIMAIVGVTAILFNAVVFAGEANVYHIVLVAMKDDVTSEQVEEMITVGKALLSQIPGVLEVAIGRKALENRDIHIKDYDVAIIVKWNNLETGKLYSPHILHQSLLKLYMPIVASLRVIDTYAN